MGKKRFAESFEDIFSPQEQIPKKSNTGKTKKANQTGKIKSTYLYDEQTLDAIRAISYYRRLPISEVLHEACKAFISSYKDLDKAIKLYTNNQSGK